MQVMILGLGTVINSSLQVGDNVYYSSIGTVPGSGFSTAGNHTIFLGTVTNIEQQPSNVFNVSVVFDEGRFAPNTSIDLPDLNDFIMFGKDKAVNSSDLTGYYAEARFVNYRTDKIELFAVSSEVVESSK
tara:strand:+ start:14608 stop:14997 length:390 start_codon:yes stop_codon:yes gene_type:complete